MVARIPKKKEEKGNNNVLLQQIQAQHFSLFLLGFFYSLRPDGWDSTSSSVPSIDDVVISHDLTFWIELSSLALIEAEWLSANSCVIDFVKGTGRLSTLGPSCSSVIGVSSAIGTGVWIEQLWHMLGMGVSETAPA